MEERIRELKELKRMREELDAEITAIEDAIKADMGEREELVAGAFKVCWKPVTSRRIDVTALRKALPELAETFTKETTTRRFSIM